MQKYSAQAAVQLFALAAEETASDEDLLPYREALSRLAASDYSDEVEEIPSGILMGTVERTSLIISVEKEKAGLSEKAGELIRCPGVSVRRRIF